LRCVTLHAYGSLHTPVAHSARSTLQWRAMPQPKPDSQEASVVFIVAAVAVGMIGGVIAIYIGMVLFS